MLAQRVPGICIANQYFDGAKGEMASPPARAHGRLFHVFSSPAAIVQGLMVQNGLVRMQGERHPTQYVVLPARLVAA